MRILMTATAAALLITGAATAQTTAPGQSGTMGGQSGTMGGQAMPGQPIRLRVAFKPTSSILTPVETISPTGEAATIATKGRHDPCVGIRGVPVVEAMAALVIADQALLHRGQCG